jgi:hypothetical protein
LIGSLFGNPFDPQKPIEAVLTDNQMNYITQKALEKGGEKGLLSYPDYGTSLSFKDLVTKPFTDPTAFSVATTAGSVGYKINPNTGKVEIAPGSFTYDWDGVKSMDFINKGGLMGAAYRLGEKFGDSNLGQKLANFNLSKTLSDLVFTPAGAAEVTPGNVQNKGLDSFNNLVSDTVMAEPNQFQDYPGVENLGGIQDQNLGFDYNFDDNVSKMEEEDAQYNIDNQKDGFNMEGILQSLGGFAKNTAGRYIGSQALGGAGGMLFGPIGGLVGGIIGALKGGDLFNQNTYSQQMYNNLTPGGKAYASSLYGPGGALEGYNQFSAFGKGTLGTIGNILAKNPNMSLARQNIYRTAADKYISGIDPTQQGYNAVTKKGGYGYDDAYINYAPPSGGGDSGSGGWSGGFGSASDW